MIDFEADAVTFATRCFVTGWSLCVLIVADPAEDVQLRHVAGGAPARNLVADGAVAVHGPRACRLRRSS